MKKLLLLAVSALMALPMVAQTEEDVTSYIKNAGFDEDISFNADGTAAKEAASTATSAASIWNYCADGSIYTRNNEGHDSFNGFVTTIKGWTTTFQAGKSNAVSITPENATTQKPEWVYFGSFRYDMPAGLFNTGRPNNDGAFTTVDPPAKPEGFDTSDNTGVLQLRAGWTNSCSYSQVVELPCAVYRLEYMVYNSGIATGNAKNLSKITCRKDVFADDTDFSSQEGINQWVKHTIEFTPTAEFTMEFGFEAQNNVSSQQPVIWIDGIKLYKIGEADPEELLSIELGAAMGDINELISQATDLGLTGLVSEMTDCTTNIDGEIGGTVESMTAALKQANADIEKFKKALAEVPAIDAALAKMENLMSTTVFPGLNEFTAAYEELIGTRESGDAETLLGLVAKIEAAILAYYNSQEASESNPADWTYLVKNPWFIKAGAEPTGNAGEGYVFPFADTYVEGEGSGTNTDLTSDGWYQSGATGGDQRLNWQRGRSCWNAWNQNFTSTLGIAQDLTNLPSGYYKVSADLITQSGYATNQHTFAKSTVQKTESPALSKEGWDTEEWETLTSDKVLVVDGKLTIGAEGTGNGTASAGWFCATNFKLWYLGEADPGALDQVIAQTVEEAKTFAATMHFAADKAALEAAANAANSADLTTLTALGEAMETAKASEAKYEEYMMDGKTLPTVATALNGEEYGAAKEIVQFAYEKTIEWLTGSEATYTEIDARVNLLKNYLNYVTAYNNAAEVAAAIEGTAKSSIEALMAQQKAALMTEVKDADTVNGFIAELKAVVFDANKQLIWETEGATDYTAFIKNPNAEAEDGWTIEKGTGNNNTASGQWFDGSNTRYFDSYNGSGLNGYIATQLVTGLPNGTYNVGVYTRTPAEGAYVFTAPAEDGEKAFTEIPMNTWIDAEGTEQVASDTHGPIWEEAKEKIEGGLAEDDPTYAYYSSIYSANNGNGRGFQHQELSATVSNHQLLIGTATGSEALQTEKVFAGNWYSVGGWTLTLVQLGDNEGWPGPLSTAKPGDVNGDGAVDVADISNIITVMATGEANPAADVNGDGAVDVADISNVISIMAANARKANF